MLHDAKRRVLLRKSKVSELESSDGVKEEGNTDNDTDSDRKKSSDGSDDEGGVLTCHVGVLFIQEFMTKFISNHTLHVISLSRIG